MHEQFVYGQIKIIDKDKPLKFLFENPDLIIDVTVKNLVKEINKVYDKADINILTSTKNVNLNTIISYKKDNQIYDFKDNY